MASNNFNVLHGEKWLMIEKFNRPKGVGAK